MNPVSEHQDVPGSMAEVRNRMRQEGSLDGGDQLVHRSILALRILTGTVRLWVFADQGGKRGAKGIHRALRAFGAVFSAETIDLCEKGMVETDRGARCVLLA